jgi:alpha-glucosidase
MQWDATAHAAFTTGEPWLPVGADYHTINVAAQARDLQSILSLYHALIRLRRAEPALSVGAYAPVAADETILSYERRHGDRRLLIALNMSGGSQALSTRHSGRVLVSTSLDRADEKVRGALDLRPNEGCIILIE